MNTILPRTTRRAFFANSAKAASFMAFTHMAPAFLARAAEVGAPRAEKDRSILVLIQLAGGNDGLNTVVPFADDRYHKLRPTLGLDGKAVLRLDDLNGFHPECGALHSCFKDGELAILQNVGYPNPNRSHFRSTEIWETASDSRESVYSGWMGRFFDNECGGVPEGEAAQAIYFGNSYPQTFESERHHPVLGITAKSGRRPANRDLLESLTRTEGANPNAGFLKHTLMDALIGEQRVMETVRRYKTKVDYGYTTFGRSMRSIAAMIASGAPTRIYFSSLSGFDTHVDQGNRHSQLMAELSRVMGAFQSDLKEKRLDSQVLTLTFSEFGRRPMENRSRGTDHGTAAPLFVMGSGVAGGILGAAPNLDIPENGDLAFETDFRRVYSTVLEDWLGCPGKEVLGGDFAKLPFLRNAG